MNDITQHVHADPVDAPKKRGRPPGAKSPLDVGRKRLREIADAASRPKGAADALAHLIAAGRLLRAAVKDRVDSFEDDELLSAALAMHESAERMVKS